MAILLEIYEDIGLIPCITAGTMKRLSGKGTTDIGY
jgi:hypothetical protein